MNTYEISRFHEYDGVHHADYTPNVGDIVDVDEDIHGVDKNGNPYTITASGFWNKNVVQLMSPVGSDGSVTLNDGSDASPIAITDATPTSFSLANELNQLLFKPAVISSNIYTKTIDTAGTVANTVLETTQRAVTSTGSFLSGLAGNIKWILIAAVVIGVIVLFSKAKSLI